MNAAMRPHDRPSEYREAVARVFARACGDALTTPPPVGKPRESGRGDFATPAALMLAKVTGEKPRAAAERLLEEIQLPPFVLSAEVAGAGFINIRVKDEAKTAACAEVLARGEDYGRQPGTGETALLEFVSANPTGPLHIGHGRAAAYGDSLAKILEFAGVGVWREYYLNDAGRQTDILAASALLRHSLPAGAQMPEGSYRGEYLLQTPPPQNKFSEREAQALLLAMKQAADSDSAADLMTAAAKKHFGEDEYKKWHAAVVQEMKDIIQKDLRAMGVEDFDRWFSERDDLRDNDKVGEALQELKTRHPEIVYENEGALWFKSTDFGDDKDRVLQRTGGGAHTYFAADIAYHRDKLSRAAKQTGKPFTHLINILGADHHGYVPRLSAAVRAFGGGKDTLQAPLIQFAALVDNTGARIKMSTREGEFVPLKFFVDEVKRDAARYFFVSRKNDQHLEVNIDLAREKSRDNPSYYLQYTHARLCRIGERAEEERGDSAFRKPREFYAALLAKEPAALSLCESMMMFPDAVRRAAANRAPHSLAGYLQEFAAAANHYYEKTEHILKDDDVERRTSRLALLTAARVVLGNGIPLLGMTAPENM